MTARTLYLQASTAAPTAKSKSTASPGDKQTTIEPATDAQGKEDIKVDVHPGADPESAAVDDLSFEGSPNQGTESR